MACQIHLHNRKLLLHSRLQLIDKNEAGQQSPDSERCLLLRKKSFIRHEESPDSAVFYVTDIPIGVDFSGTVSEGTPREGTLVDAKRGHDGARPRRVMIRTREKKWTAFATAELASVER